MVYFFEMSSISVDHGAALNDSLQAYESRKLCSSCKGIMENLPGGDHSTGISVSHHKSFDAFQIAIQDGCYICSRVRASAIGTELEHWVVNGTAITEKRNSFTSFLFRSYEYQEVPELMLTIRIGDSQYDSSFFIYRYQGK